MMTRENIRSRLDEILNDMREQQSEREKACFVYEKKLRELDGELRKLQEECKHSATHKVQRYLYDGILCEDCGKEWSNPDSEFTMKK